MLNEFKVFLLRGNILDLAIGFIAGTVFGAVVKSMVDDVIMPLIAAVVGQPDFSSLVLTINGSDIRYGALLTALTTFLLTMAGVFFLIVKPVNTITAKLAPAKDDEGPTMRECPLCLSEVPAKASRCAHCTGELTPL